MKQKLERLLAAEGTKFLIVGGVSYVVNAIALYAFYEHILAGVSRSVETPFGGFNLALFVASAIAVEIAIIVRFLLNDGWTFRDRREKSLRRRFAQSNITSLGSPLISILCVNVLTPIFGGSYQIALSIGVLLGLAWNWTWSSKVVWRRAEKTSEPVEVVQVR